MYFNKFIFSMAIIFASQAQAVSTVLYNQNFNNPVGFLSDSDQGKLGDVNVFTPVNTLYGNQPAGFQFAQTFTVETLRIGGTEAYNGSGYSDPTGTGGSYALGMQSRDQDDKLGLSFDIGSNNFLNVQLDISSIGISVFDNGAPWFSSGAKPVFEFTLYDNPSGAIGIDGNGTVLSTLQATGTASAVSLFDWVHAALALDASGNTNGNVTLQIDLLSGGYGSLDNFFIVATPVPGAIWLFGSSLIGLIIVRKNKSKTSAFAA